MLNQQIGPYKITKLLGEGGFAHVYLAEKGVLGRKVALKVLKEEFLSDRQIRGRFFEEAKSMFHLNHPNIVSLYDLVDERDLIAIELEYIEGENLRNYLKRMGVLSNDLILSLLNQMLDALNYIHQKGLIHRDIKPSNFIVSPKGIIKLTDFGIAKNTDITKSEYTKTRTGMAMGTAKYMSPEQVINTKQVTFQSDFYSLGVVLWEMVTGRVPYDIKTQSEFEIYRKVVDEPLSLTNTQWDELIQSATLKDPKKRVFDLSLIRNEADAINAPTEDVFPTEDDEDTINYEQLKSILIVATVPHKRQSENGISSEDITYYKNLIVSRINEFEIEIEKITAHVKKKKTVFDVYIAEHHSTFRLKQIEPYLIQVFLGIELDFKYPLKQDNRNRNREKEEQPINEEKKGPLSIYPKFSSRTGSIFLLSFLVCIALFVFWIKNETNSVDEPLEVDFIPSTFTDTRDNKVYKIVEIGNQTWMAENLAYKPTSGNYWAYDNNSSNIAKYGYLYDWETACKVCPNGWHLPSDAEWTILTDYLGGENVAGTKMKSSSGWRANGNGSNASGFSGLPGGFRDYFGIFGSVGANGYWWSSTEYVTDDAWYRRLGYNDGDVKSYLYVNKEGGLSVRCLRD